MSVVLIVIDKTRENRIRWFRHVRIIDKSVRCCNSSFMNEYD